uniref:Uncharacterized protein n=1 Tax=Cucumis melo TaxID=3656 RepID=A0A9I9ED56_CUCME
MINLGVVMGTDADGESGPPTSGKSRYNWQWFLMHKGGVAGVGLRCLKMNKDWEEALAGWFL